MEKSTPDTGLITQPEEPTLGMSMMAGFERHARKVYPDHGESRQKLVNELAATALDTLNRQVAALQQRPASAGAPASAGVKINVTINDKVVHEQTYLLTDGDTLNLTIK